RMTQKGASPYADGSNVTQRRQSVDKTLSDQGRKYKERSTNMGIGLSPGSKQSDQLEQGNIFQILEELEPDYEMQIPRNTPRKNG
ncbi:hypothetical protein HAX54_007958, partial [Datura stramonium]|nr:hypothetical protein [Datura stramonium]